MGAFYWGARCRESMRRARVLFILPLLLAAGCLNGDAPGDAEGSEWFQESRQEGTLVSARAGDADVTPDQLGDNHREFYVHEDARTLTLRLDSTGGTLVASAGPRGCSPCPVSMNTDDGATEVTIEAPAPGPWLLKLSSSTTQAPEISYAFDVAQIRAQRPLVEQETYEGSVVAAHLGAIRISPDQLGDVYREFWVSEGTTKLVIDVEAGDELEVVTGRANPARDQASEESWPTEGGRVTLSFDDPAAGGWYVIFFHPASGGPGAREVAYTMLVEKTLAPL